MGNKNVIIGIGISILIVIFATIILIFGLKEDNTYKVTFDSGNNGKHEVVEVTENGIVSKPANPTKEGYTFEGWYYNGEKFDFSSKITKDIILEARWSEAAVQKWTVTFDSNGGNNIEDLNVEDGKVIVDVPAPERDGYSFIGWYYGNEEFDFNTVITKNLTLTAKWKKQEKPVSGTNTAVSYSVKFDSNGGSSIKTQNVEKNKTVLKPNNPVRDGYAFIGWYNGNVLYNFSSKVTKDITLTAKWEKIVPKYTVTFNSDGGSSITSQTVEDGKTATKPSNPIKSGYTFIGWYNGSTEFNFDTQIRSNITLIAKYTKEVVISYVIEDVPNSLYNQAKLYILKDGIKVKGTIDVTNSEGKIITKTVDTNGIDIVKDTYTYSNPKIVN